MSMRQHTNDKAAMPRKDVSVEDEDVTGGAEVAHMNLV